MKQKEVLSMEKNVPETRDVTSRAEEERASTEVKAMIFLARQNPRNERKAMAEIERIAKIPEFAVTAFYSYPRGQKEIFGASINLAQEMVRLWGNAITKMQIPFEDENEFALDVMAWDLETNYIMQRQVRIQKLIQRKVQGGRTEWIRPDERDKRELMERHHSLLRRNCILGIFPRWFVDKVVGLARETVKKKVGKSNIEDLRKALLADFENMGIYREQIENYLGHSLAATTVDEITELQGVLRSIKDGVTNRNDYFGQEAQRKGPPQEQKKDGDISLDEVMSGEVKHEGSKEGPEPPVPPEQSKPSQPEWDARILEDFKNRLKKCSTAVEVQKYMKEVKATKAAAHISDDLLAQMLSLANDRMREILKREAN